jgi:molecular chaperone DnaK
MLKKNQTYPCSFEADFPMSFDNMIEVKLPVLEGESEDPSENTELGLVVLELDGNHKKGDLVHVKFEIDDSGIIQVSAKDHKTNKSVVGEIKRNSLLSKEEIVEAKKDSENDFFLM